VPARTSSFAYQGTQNPDARQIGRDPGAVAKHPPVQRAHRGQANSGVTAQLINTPGRLETSGWKTYEECKLTGIFKLQEELARFDCGRAESEIWLETGSPRGRGR